MSVRRGRQGQSIVSKVIVALVVTLICIVSAITLVFGSPVKNLARQAKKKAAEVVVDQAIEKVTKSDMLGEEAEEIRDMLDQIPPEDKAAVTEIIADHMDVDTISSIAGDLMNGDMQSAIDYAQNNLTEEEQETLRALAEKYGY